MALVQQRSNLTVTWAAAQVINPQPVVASTWSAEEIPQEHDGYWTVHDPETGIFGSGPDREAAYADFRRALEEHLDVLEREDALSSELSAQLAYLHWRLQQQ